MEKYAVMFEVVDRESHHRSLENLTIGYHVVIRFQESLRRAHVSKGKFRNINAFSQLTCISCFRCCYMSQALLS